MKKIKELLGWTGRAWPLHFLLLAIGVHALVLTATDFDRAEVNGLASLILQLAGGGLLLYSIDSNIGILRKKSLLSEFSQYLREFPLVRRSVTLHVQGSSHVVTGAKARLTAGRNPASVDEHIKYLQEQIDALRREYREDLTEIRRSLEKKSTELGGRLDTLSQSVRDIESKFDQVAVGDVRFQILGVIFVVYGAIAGYVA